MKRYTSLHFYLSLIFLIGCVEEPKEENKTREINVSENTLMDTNSKNVVKEIETTSPTEVKVVGGDVDAHGCKSSAGYQWSIIENKCIRVFELPLTLKNPTGTMIAGVVFSSDKNTAEVLLVEGVSILNKQGENKYQSLDYKTILEKVNNKWKYTNSRETEITYQEQ